MVFLLPSQYYYFSQFSVIGVVGCWYVQVGEQLQSSLESIIMFSVCDVYRDGGYIQVVEDCARESVAKARRR